MPEKPEINLEDAFQGLFKDSSSGSGEEELLRIASRYSLQLSAAQCRALLYLQDKASTLKDENKKIRLNNFVENWLKFRQYCGSEMFITKALETISLRRYLNESSFKVNVEK